ncbi:hypothetical protein FAM09_01480 [Niastella caeni]|uniref:Methylamine utilisation protein MauE domain-containing protein n=1 Tax=Niastella caeni TaxID=2569763 RepID=A0A4S8HZJ5_9BACT|nr:MauE/DoxX family redox-associated membrane protein [Niastella caeni]THU40811.1 hypothetical protein FAM09_01480 [Niastella caeni]
MKNVALSGESSKRNNITQFVIEKRNTIINLITYLLILLFLYTSTSKLLDFNKFINEINIQPFPNWVKPYLIYTLIPIEIIISISLIFDKTRKTGLWAALILMILFTVYSSLVLFRFFDRIPCSCGGVIENLTWTQHLFFNLFFVGISCFGIILSKKETF